MLLKKWKGDLTRPIWRDTDLYLVKMQTAPCIACVWKTLQTMKRQVMAYSDAAKSFIKSKHAV